MQYRILPNLKYIMMGKLDAIFAKLKNKQTTENGARGTEDNNNTKDLINLNDDDITKRPESTNHVHQTLAGASKRKSRKSRPRNIAELSNHTEELHEDDPVFTEDDRKWNIDSRNSSECDSYDVVSFSQSATPEEMEPLDLSAAETRTSVQDDSLDDSQDAGKLVIDESLPEDSVDVPLDLTVCKSSKSVDSDTGKESGFNSIPFTAEIPSTSPAFPPDSSDTKILNDYAKNTMNELLKIYGLNGNASTAEQSDLQLTKYHVAQMAATANFGLMSAEHKTTETSTPSPTMPVSTTPLLSTTVNGTSTAPVLKKGIFSSIHKPLIHQQNGFFKFHHAKHVTGRPFAPKLTSIKGFPANKPLLPDYTKYLKRYSNGNQCGGTHCKQLGYKEHYHCLDCSKVYIKKEEMVRHFKWHKKREESLQHGFMRYSPMDNCQPKFGHCTHNGRQTHYHCIQSGCDKVYISTSDVQMHANYHRKDSAIILEGFQRFRATEDCGTTSCQFYGQRTTHFHCRRASCNFTFKNKADMEKHKTYHQKDEILAKDGFKKFMKYENCFFPNCKYTKISNHIHCIRPGCDYVLHSTAQLYSHKRKHERRDFESAYQSFRLTQPKVQNGRKSSMNIPLPPTKTTAGLLTSIAANTAVHNIPKISIPVQISDVPTPANVTNQNGCNNLIVKNQSGEATTNLSRETTPDKEITPVGSTLDQYGEEISGEKLNDSLTLPIPRIATNSADVKSLTPVLVKDKLTYIPDSSKSSIDRKDKDESWKNYLKRYTANDPCHSRCKLLYKDHYHCKIEGCDNLFRAKDAVREHAKFHEQQNRISPMVYQVYEDNDDCERTDCPFNGNKKHYHCNWATCNEVIDAEGPMFARLEHYRVHEYAKGPFNKFKLSPPGLTDDDSSRRRRGRPPKYPLRIPTVPKVNLTDSEITDSVQRYLQGDMDESSKVINGFKKFEADESCPDDLCLFAGKAHYHCARSRCYHATDRMDVLNLHAKDFHNFVTILEGYEFFDRDVNCRRKHCHNNKTNRHFHCMRPGCDYSFVRHNTMTQHEKKHANSVSGQSKSSKTPTSFVPIVPNTSVDLKNKNVVKAAGTFYPLSGLNNNLPTLVSVPGTPMVSVAQPGLLSSAPLISSTPGATILPINPLHVSGLGLVPQLILPSNPTLQTFVPVSLASNESGATSPASFDNKTDVTNGEPSWSELRNSMHFTNNQNCLRPFCKLKKKDHYHCQECNQAFSDPARLRNHIGKHGIKFKRGAPSDGDCLDLSRPVKKIKLENAPIKVEPELTSSSLNLDPNVFSNMWKSEEMDEVKIKTESMEESSEGKSADGEEIPRDLSKWSGRKRTATKHEDFIDSDEVLPKFPKLSSAGSPKVQQETERSLEGYSRFRFNEDCGHIKCAYKHSSTHYHCLRPDCGYGFSDRSRLVQHSLRHERLDKIMGDEFRQFRASVQCCFPDCEYSSKSSHFHCLKCSFSCADSSKVSAHRKYHLKMDNISSKGFTKFIGNQDCGIPFCAHAKKQTHYHCTFPNCNHAVLGPSQMAPHKLKHSNHLE